MVEDVGDDGGEEAEQQQGRAGVHDGVQPRPGAAHLPGEGTQLLERAGRESMYQEGSQGHPMESWPVPQPWSALVLSFGLKSTQVGKEVGAPTYTLRKWVLGSVTIYCRPSPQPPSWYTGD